MKWLLSFLFLPAVIANVFTVGGISSGCFMSTQFHFAFSSIISGNACTAGGPYWCAQANLNIALNQCMKEPYANFIDINYLESVVYSTELTGFIDPVGHLANSRVWLLSATNDTVVATKVVESNAKLYERFISTKSIKLVTNIPGQHAQLTNVYGNQCNYLGSPYINHCNYSSAWEGLSWILNQPNQLVGPNKWYSENLFPFDQTKYIPGPYEPAYGLGKTGYVYIPTKCNQAKSNCPTHIVFHGCLQTLEFVGMDFIKYSGYLEVAEPNGIIILFPQATSTPTNPNGCWDWWGYTGTTYASNIGIQMLTVKNQITSKNFPYL